MSRFGLDYAWTQISSAEHHSVGSTFACRYLSFDYSKNLTADEARELRSGGISIVVVWESSAGRALSGYSGGRADAEAALQQARNLGIPNGRPIYFAVDFDEAPDQANQVAGYFEGVNSILGVNGTGAYGGYWSIKRLFDAHLIKYGWQSYAWSGGMWDSRAQIQQYSNERYVAGHNCDYDRTTADDFGQWDYKGSPVPIPIPTPKEDIVSIAVAPNKYGALEVFVEKTDGSVFHTWQNIDDKGHITGWNGGVPGKKVADWASLGKPGA